MYVHTCFFFFYFIDKGKEKRETNETLNNEDSRIVNL